MTLQVLSFILGAILLAVGVLGGGIEVKEIKIPKVTLLVRTLSACIGLVFILLGLWIAKIIPPDIGRAPDLIIESLKHSPADPNTADTITFTAVVKNIGAGTARSSTLALKVGEDTTPKTYPVPALEPGKTHTVRRQESLPVAQLYRNTATADLNNEVDESDETNNQKTYDYQVGPSVVQRIPDLIIESLKLSPARPTTADTITFTSVVKNIGLGKAGASTLALRVGGETSPKTFAIPALGPGGTHTVQRKEVLRSAQRYRNTATADFKKEVRESNETNNQKTDVYDVYQVKAPSVFSRGTVVIRGTWSCDLDRGRETQTGADFFWQQRTNTIRSVVPRNGARFHVLGRRNFDSITYFDLTKLTYC